MRPKSAEELRQQIHAERDALVDATNDLRAALREATDISAKLEAKLPLLAVGALVVGFVLFGGIGATARLLARRSREGRAVVELGRFKIVKR